MTAGMQGTCEEEGIGAVETGEKRLPAETVRCPRWQLSGCGKEEEGGPE